MTSYVYIDNSNIYIEGSRVAAVNKGLAKNISQARDRNIVDRGWQLDYGKLYDFLCEDGDVARLWGSPPPGDTFWNILKTKGFNPTVYEKNAANQEKKVDVAIAHRMTKDAYTLVDREKDEIILVAGDTDYIPVIVDLVSEGFKVEIAFWDHLAYELRQAATKHIPLNVHHAHFTR
jgi:NYN domain